MGMELSYPQGFIGVDVSQSSQKPLVEEQRFEPPLPSGKHLSKLVSSQVITQWLGSQVPDHPIWIRGQHHSTKLALIGEPDPAIVLKI
jgi:hypothetical protein